MYDINKYEECLKIGFIQTNLDGEKAWGVGRDFTLNMKAEWGQKVWSQIKLGIHKLYNHHDHPNIIIMPELTLPHNYKNELRQFATLINSVVIAGLDYTLEKSEIRNQALLIVPNKWDTPYMSYKSSVFVLGKKNLAFEEKGNIEKFKKHNSSSYRFIKDMNIYLIDAYKYGKIGFAICADFYDLERFIAYKGKVQHIIILAYNKDTNSFFALAEAISRLVMCNVVICNTGFYGDSMVFCPYAKSHKRQKFRHQGAGLFDTQVIKLPVKDLVKEQIKSSENKNTKKFKSPPGYKIEGLL